MTRTLRGMLPFAIALLAIGVATSWLLSRDMAAGTWLLAAVLLGHGLVHAMFMLPTSAVGERDLEWPFDIARAWPVTALKLDLATIRRAALAVIVVVVGGFAIAALATIGVLPAGWWQPAVAASSIASGALLILLFDPQLVFGLGIDAVLLWSVVAGAWAP